MSKCPYTWFKNIFSGNKNESTHEAQFLRVAVIKNTERVVDVTLPAKSARWLIDLIPDDVTEKIKAEGIPIEEIQKNLSLSVILYPQEIFKLIEPHRAVEVWLE